ncbi:hypothetical protein CC80DRAFT_470586 [Byssothecium circinans]|uniref:BTB domain-containing protein n=1 Tax=Byssothecium circinans TaxID=147558 RepID=A0A6A5TYG1_9PLEO|nr:hypothetical protein CC80DRAFT_470586 [Byssothecium circinans]
MGLIPFQPADAFPVFKTGDVIIRAELGAEPVTFQLHSSVLIRHSPWFAKAFQFRPPKDHCSNWYLFKLENTGGKVSLVQHDTEGDRPILSHSTASQVVHGVEIKVEDVFENTANRISSTRTTPSTMTARNSSPPVRKVSPKAALACYTQVLGAFYSIPPPISTVNISTALVQAEELVKLAADLGCLHLLRPYLGHVLGEYRQKLFVAIKQDPPRWVRLALSLENKSIYTECLVHLIGAHPKWPWSTGRAALPEDLRRLVFNKAHEVEVARTEIERDLLLINLPYGRNATPPDPTQPGQTETWITVQIIRDQLALRIDSLDRSKEAALHRGKFFRQLRKGTLEVLDLENVRTICQGTMPSTWKDLRDDLKQLKEYVAELVEEIASNELMIDPDTNNIGYLTCAKVGNDDIPWIQTAGSSS